MERAREGESERERHVKHKSWYRRGGGRGKSLDNRRRWRRAKSSSTPQPPTNSFCLPPSRQARKPQTLNPKPGTPNPKSFTLNQAPQLHARALTRAPDGTPCILHPTPYSPHPALCTLHPTSYILHPTPYTLHPTPDTVHPTPYTLHPTPCTPHPTPYTLHPTPYTPHPTPYTLGAVKWKHFTRAGEHFLATSLWATAADSGGNHVTVRPPSREREFFMITFWSKSTLSS